MSTKPIRGQRRRGAPSLVLPGDPDGCGWIAMGDGLYQACGVNVAHWRHLTRQHVRAQYVGSPTRWGNPYRVERHKGGWRVRREGDVWAPLATEYDATDAAVCYFDELLMCSTIAAAQFVAPLVTADVLSCWCPLDTPCHGDTLCDLVGRLRSGDLVPGLVADPDVCGGALRIDGTRTDAEWVAGAITERLGWENWSEDRAVLTIAAECSIDPELVRVAARVGGAL
jgi:hypothetical protein